MRNVFPDLLHEGAFLFVAFKYDRHKKLKLIDKRGALDSLARHLGMFVDKQEVSVVQPPKIIVELSNE
jgi:hypothetical protein